MGAARSNQIINNLDALLASGHRINDLVSELDNIRIIANYDLLTQKGAASIDLAAIRDSVDPEVVLNNLEVFQKAGVATGDLTATIHKLASGTWSYDAADIKKWIKLGTNPQFIADRYVRTGDDLRIVEALIDAGAHVDANRIIDNILRDSDPATFWFEDFVGLPYPNALDDYNTKNVSVLKRAGASPEAIHKLLKRVSESTTED